MAWRAGLWRGSANSGVMPTVGPADHAAGLDRRATPDQLPIWRIGIISGLVGMLCCVGPTILALVGIISAATAFAWANDLYELRVVVPRERARGACHSGVVGATTSKPM